MSDKYDEAIALLLDNGKLNSIKYYNAWNMWHSNPSGCLFSIVSESGEEVVTANGEYMGCLTQIRNGDAVACTETFTEAIRADERIPCTPEGITEDSLYVFAEWQSRLDKEFSSYTGTRAEPTCGL